VAPSTSKKVLVARFKREPVQGFVQTPGGFLPEGVELLSPSGSLLTIPYTEAKAVCFVRDFESGETWRERRSYATRPKMPGLWVRCLFRDGDSIEGILANNLMLMDPLGFYVVPPDPTFQNQRIFLPKAALTEVHVLGVIGSPLRPRRTKSGPTQNQLEMF